MTNPLITAKERNLIKGAIRRVFSRSEIRRQVVNLTVLTHHVDTSRPRVKTWCLCFGCNRPTPKSYMQVDHIIPVIKIHESLQDLSWDDLVNGLWCDIKNLTAICRECHELKTKRENQLRREFKRGNSTQKNKVPRRKSRRRNPKLRRI